MSEMPDWLSVVHEHADSADAEFELDRLRPGDRLDVVTRHTTYCFSLVTDRDADLDTGRVDRPSGRVHLQGCRFGDSSSIKPGHLFCGGCLEFNFICNGARMEHRTTPIREIRHLRRAAGPASGSAVAAPPSDDS